MILHVTYTMSLLVLLVAATTPYSCSREEVAYAQKVEVAQEAEVAVIAEAGQEAAVASPTTIYGGRGETAIVTQDHDYAVVVQSPVTSETSESTVKFFTLVNADAAEVVDAVTPLFGSHYGVPTIITSHQGSNSVLARGSADELQVLEALVLQIDERSALSGATTKVEDLTEDIDDGVSNQGF